MRRTRGRAGFSLIELIIACSLCSLVLVALVTVSAAMVKFQMDSIKKGKITAWSLLASTQINKELQDHNVLAWPTSGTPTADTLVACKNWSRTIGGKIDPAVASEALAYCFDPTVAPTTKLRRFYLAAVDCPDSATYPASLPACSDTPGGIWAGAVQDIIATNVVKAGGGGTAVFTYDNTVNGVRIQYIVGNTVASNTEKTPQNIPYDFRIGMARPFQMAAE